MMNKKVFNLVYILLLLYFLMDLSTNILIKNRYIEITNTDSKALLNDFEKFNIVNNIVEDFMDKIYTKKFFELSKVTCLAANKTTNEYNDFIAKYNITDEIKFKTKQIKILSDDVYKCEGYIVKGENKEEISIFIKLNEANSSYKIINFMY